MKRRAVKSINYKEEDLPNLDRLEDILRREGKEYADWGREQTVNYVKIHGEGNPAFRLDPFMADPGFEAIPARSVKLTEDYLSAQDEKTLDQLEEAAREDIQRIHTERVKRHPPQDMSRAKPASLSAGICEHCGKPMVYGRATHYDNWPACRPSIVTKEEGSA